MKRLDVIDGFRGVAISAVLAFHYTVRWPDITKYDHVFVPAWEIGQYGVELFFVISGLVITMTVLKSVSLSDFAVKRLARLYPAFLVAAVTTFVLMQFGPAEFRRTPLDMLANLTMLPADLGRAPIDGAYWSLAFELRFYAVAGLIWLWMRERFWLGMLGVGLVSGAAKLTGIGDQLLFSAYWPYFLFGMAGWYGVFERHKAAAASLGGTSLALYVLNRPDAGLAADVLVLGSSALMFALLAVKAQKIGPLAGLGRISYSLYLIHQFLGVTLIGLLTPYLPDVVAITLVCIVMIGLAWAMYRYVERPGQQLILEWWRNLRPQDVSVDTQAQEAA